MTKPAPIALVVCDNVYQEPGGKAALVGIFNRIVADKFPIKHSRLCVYASVTDVHPGTKFRLEIVHSETDEHVAALGGPPPQGTNPTTICDFNFVLQNLIFKEPGLYYIRFWGDEHLLLQRPFEVTEAQGKEDKPK